MSEKEALLPIKRIFPTNALAEGAHCAVPPDQDFSNHALGTPWGPRSGSLGPRAEAFAR